MPLLNGALKILSFGDYKYAAPTVLSNSGTTKLAAYINT